MYIFGIAPVLCLTMEGLWEAVTLSAEKIVDWEWMNILAWCAAGLLGWALGRHFGRLLHAVIDNWESTQVASKAFTATFSMLLGGTGVAMIDLFVLDSQTVVAYVAALSVALSLSPKMPTRYAGDTRFRQVVLDTLVEGLVKGKAEPTVLKKLVLRAILDGPVKTPDKGFEELLGKVLDDMGDPFADEEPSDESGA